MKFYVTGRSNNYERVKDAFARIKSAGHTITFEWTELPMAKPYKDNAERAAHYALESIKGVVDADVYVVFVHADGNGVYTEFGAALAANVLKNKPQIYAIGEEEKSVAMFNYHPAIQWRPSVEDILIDFK